MNKNDKYREILINTLSKTSIYNDLQKRAILRKLKKDKIIELIGTTDLIELIRDDNEKVSLITDIIEEYEIEKPYNYFFLYLVNNADSIEKIEEHLEKMNTENRDCLSTELEKPKYNVNEKDKIITLKFSYVLAREGQPNIKYPLLCDFIEIKDEIFLRFSFGIIPDSYKDEEFYLRLSYRVEKWLKDNLEIELYNVNTFNAVENMLEYKKEHPALLEHITEHSQCSNDLFQGNLKLRANDKEDLPLLAELNGIVEKFESEKDKELMNFFFKKLKQTSDFYQRGLKWHWEISENKEETLVLEFKKNYMKSGKTFVHIHRNKLSKEMVNDVIKDLAQYRDLSKLREQFKQGENN